MVTQNQVDKLHDKGTNRLLADISATPMTLEDRLADVRRRILNRIGANHKAVVSYYADDSGKPYYVRITMPGGQCVSAMGADLIDTTTRCLREWSAEVQRTAIAERVEREMKLAAKIDAADLLTGEIFTDTGEATTGTLPLVSKGPSGIGGQYQSEVRG